MSEIDRAIEDYKKAEKNLKEWIKEGCQKDLPVIIKPIDTLILPFKYKSRRLHSARMFKNSDL